VPPSIRCGVFFLGGCGLSFLGDSMSIYYTYRPLGKFGIHELQ
jgi:hypothetical protein